jgi:hypothetical protein
VPRRVGGACASSSRQTLQHGRIITRAAPRRVCRHALARQLAGRKTFVGTGPRRDGPSGPRCSLLPRYRTIAARWARRLSALFRGSAATLGHIEGMATTQGPCQHRCAAFRRPMCEQVQLNDDMTLLSAARSKHGACSSRSTAPRATCATMQVTCSAGLRGCGSGSATHQWQ